jgi:hypothetical protein
MTGRDSNRGACAQPCRYQYALMEEKRPGEYFPVFEDEKGTYILNSRDMCMIDHLKELQEAGVDDLYIGVECGLNDVLENLNKGYSADDTREQCLRLNAAGIGHCDLLMLGTAGKGRGLECARASAKLENEIQPRKILINTMSAFVGTELDEEIKAGAFLPASEKENLEEEREFLAGLDLPDCYFWALHPLDSVKIDGILREEKQQMLDALTRSIEHVNESRINRTSRVGTL